MEGVDALQPVICKGLVMDKQSGAKQTPMMLEYGVEPVSKYERLLRPFRIIAFVALLIGGYLSVVTFRCWGAGFSPHITLLLSAILITPFAIVAFLGLPWKRYCKVVLLAILLPAVLAEGHATVEEQLFLASVRNLPPTAKVVSKPRRWWPNGSSYLFYDPATRTLGGGD
jgi:hypothetical protein